MTVQRGKKHRKMSAMWRFDYFLIIVSDMHWIKIGCKKPHTFFPYSLLSLANEAGTDQKHLLQEMPCETNSLPMPSMPLDSFMLSYKTTVEFSLFLPTNLFQFVCVKYRDEQVRLLKCKTSMYYLWFCPWRAFGTTEAASTVPLLYKMERKISILATKEYFE